MHSTPPNTSGADPSLLDIKGYVRALLRDTSDEWIMPTVPKNYRRLTGSERKPGSSAKLLGPADPAETFTVTIVLRRGPGGPPVPDASYYLRTPPVQRRRLPNDDFARKSGADEADIDKVTGFANAQGLTIVETHVARRPVVVSGTVAQFNEAFRIWLHSPREFRHDSDYGHNISA